MPDEYVSRCPTEGCHGFVIVRCGQLQCMNCDWSAPIRDIEHHSDVRKTGEPFNPPRRRPHPGVKN
jgi:hypothetical protein